MRAGAEEKLFALTQIMKPKEPQSRTPQYRRELESENPIYIKKRYSNFRFSSNHPLTSGITFSEIIEVSERDPNFLYGIDLQSNYQKGLPVAIIIYEDKEKYER